jgi:hypothetical protein
LHAFLNESLSPPEYHFLFYLKFHVANYREKKRMKYLHGGFGHKKIEKMLWLISSSCNKLS